jgi:subtilase-type serine protease
VPGYDFSLNAIAAIYRPADYRPLYTATSVAALQTASVNRFLGELNAYLTNKRAAAAAKPA